MLPWRGALEGLPCLEAVVPGFENLFREIHLE
jgi:hypothetical protein